MDKKRLYYYIIIVSQITTHYARWYRIILKSNAQAFYLYFVIIFHIS